MPSKYQTGRYPTHSTSTTQQIRPNSYVTWQLHYPNWLDLLQSNTVLPHDTSPYPSLAIPYLYPSALSPVTTIKFKFHQF